MGTFKVDNEKVNDSVKTLNKLLDECEELYNKEIPESDIDKGLTHNELYNLCQNIRKTCQCLGELINNTILFLGKSSEMFDTSDKESASAIAGTAAQNVNETGESEIVDNGQNTSNYTGFNEKVEAMKNTDGFREGEKWGYDDKVEGFDTENGYVYKPSQSCCAKARQMQAYVTGNVALQPSGLTDPRQIQPGDVLYYNNEHWVFVIGVNGDTISIGEGNYIIKENYEGMVHYRDININDLSPDNLNIYRC